MSKLAPTNDDARLLGVEALKALSEVDLLYADRFLHRAELLLGDLCSRKDHLSLRREQDRLPHVTAELRQATERGDWSRVRLLAEDAAARKGHLAAKERVLKLADAIYGPRILRADAAALALNGVVGHPTAALERDREAVVEHLRVVAAEDGDLGAFYTGRAEYFARLEVVSENEPGALVDVDAVRKRILEAVDRADFSEVRRLTDAIVDERGKFGRTRVPVPRNERAEILAAPFPTNALVRASDLPGHAWPQVQATDRRFVSLSGATGKGRAFGTTAADVGILPPFMSSAGTRYLPWFGVEALLVETFPETEPDAPTAFLDRLGLRQRRGLPRLMIEDALRSHSVRLCEELGLDPLEFTVACVPFDAYARLAPQREWGRSQLWTHFDGYQVTKDLQLQALVGGDVRYGGADDFCAVQRDYDVPRITARFCVLRCERFLARHQADADSVGLTQ